MHQSLKKYIPFFIFVISLDWALSFPLQATGHLSIASPAKIVSQDLQNYYERGLKETNLGNLNEGLSIWEEAVEKLEEPDFRIAQSYIQTVVSNKLKKRYLKATEIYYWGLEGKIDANEQSQLLKELDYLRPLIGEGKYKDYKNAVGQKEADVLKSITRFWVSVDDTPLTTYNERMIEHWERIHYALENYSKSDAELDDRGKIYLKYGHPFYNKKGQLKYISSLVTRLLREGIQTPSFASADDIAISVSQRMSMENRVRQYHTYPMYEVWIYRSLNDENQNTIFMFGTPDGISTFRKIQSIEDFIPSQAYRTIGQNNYSVISNSSSSSGSQTNGRQDSEVRFNSLRSSRQVAPEVDFSPALILQLMYYHQFAALDMYFGKAYNEMMDRFVDQSNTIRKGMAREFGTMYGNKLIQIQARAINEVSSYTDAMMSLPVAHYQYRFLDDHNATYVKLFAIADLEEAAYYDLLKDTNSLQTDISGRYDFISGYRLEDEDDDGSNSIIEMKSKSPTAIDHELTEIINISYDNEEYVLISHELRLADAKSDSSVSDNSVFPESLKGLSNEILELPEPFEPSDNSDSQKLLMSDLILGYTALGSNSKKNAQEALFDFTAAHDKVIPKGMELNLYYEIYNLKRGAKNKQAEYKFRYAIRQESKGFLGIGKKLDDEQLSISFTNTVNGTREGNSIIIDTSNYGAGKYELQIEVTDLVSGETYQRKQAFQIGN